MARDEQPFGVWEMRRALASCNGLWNRMQISRLLGIKESSLRQQFKRHGYPGGKPITLNGQHFYTGTDVYAWLQRRGKYGSAATFLTLMREEKKRWAK